MERTFAFLLIFHCSKIVLTENDQPDLTFLLDYKEGNATCVVGQKTLESAVFIENEETVVDSSSKYIPADYVFDEIKWVSPENNWEGKNSVNQTFGPVADERWEEFQILDENRTWPYYNFKSIPISVYNSSQKTLLRVKFTDNWILDIYPSHTILYMNNSPQQAYIFENVNQRWIFFTIIRDNSKIIVIFPFEKNKKISFDAKTNLGYEILHLTNQGLRGKKELRYKIHYYNFLYSDEKTDTLTSPQIRFMGKFCLSMFIALCNTCSMNINVKIYDADVINLSISAPKNQNGFYLWKKIILKSETTNYSKGKAVLSVETINKEKKGFWAIDNIRVCSLSEVRIVTVKATSRSNLICQNLVNSTFRVGLSSNNNANNSECVSPQLGHFCNISCGSIFNSGNYCGNKLCTNAGCTCSYGYEGYDCNSACDRKWGKNCAHFCGKCKDNKECNRYNGECNSGCEKRFIGKTCEEELPVLEKAPTVIQRLPTTITIQISKSFDSSIDLKKISPQRIHIQYRLYYPSNTNLNWVNSVSINFNGHNQATITGLQSDTSYEIRALLVTAEDDIYDGKDVPTVRSSTTCIEYIEDNLIIEPNATFAKFIRHDNVLLCNWGSYNLYLETNDSPPYQINILQKIFDVKTIPFTNYVVTVTNKYTNHTFKKYFKTKPTEPKKVIISMTNVTSNSAVLEWEPPTREQGDVIYRIKYKHLGFIACKNNNSNEAEVQQDGESSIIRLLNLRPYSFYVVSIEAENEVKKSAATIVSLATDASDDLSGVVPINVWSVKDNITIEKPTCDRIKGQVIYELEYTYKSNVDIDNDVCVDKSDKIKDTIGYDDVNNYYPPKNLIPYANYIVTISVKFKNGKTHDNSVQKHFQTKPEAPSEVRNLTVYSKNETFVWLRWTRPCPTNGDIESYLITYTTNKITKNSTVVGECKIWRSQVCAVIKVRPIETYRIEVTAKNRNVNEYGPAVENITASIEEESEAPKNVTHTFNGPDKLVLYWEHPDVTNGPLVFFLIHGIVTDKRMNNYVPNIDVKYNTNMEMLTFTKEITVSPAITYNITILPFNKKKGKSVTTTVITPPPMPKLSSDPIFSKPCSNGICDIEIPGTLDCINCTIYVVVNNKLEEFNTSPFQNMPFYLNLKNEKSEILNSTHWIAKIINNTNLPSYSFSIGNISDKMRPVFNKSNYIISVILINEYKGMYSTGAYLLHGLKDPEDSANLNYLLFLLLLVLIAIVLLIIYRRKLKDLITKTDQEQLLTVPQNSKPTSKRKSNKLLGPTQFSLKSSRQGENVPMKKLPPKKDSFSQIIEISKLKSHLEESLEGGRDSCRLSKQHEMVGSGHIKPINIGSMEVNKSKNRYKNLVAYDHSRVKLKHKTADGSDYINANYIDGYKVKNAYIATQGPKATTVDDFWYMIWQQDVENIVMLANVVEGGKKKCEEYWPPQDETKCFKEMSVKNVKTVISASYTYREFCVVYKESERIINHLHFTNWPDHGVPLYPQSLVPFVQKMLRIPQGKHPIVVHCSAGVGRTGTILLCDIALRMAAYEHKVDFFGIFYQLRQHRVNLVDNSAQYILAHLVVYECLFGRDLSIPINVNCEKSIKIILEETTVRPIMDYLNEINWQINIMQEWFDNEEVTKKASCHKDKNRFSSILPGCSQIYLNKSHEDLEDSSYINAVSVDCFQCESRYIVTQQPLPNTVGDFWRMVLEYNVKIIISLNEIRTNDPTSCIFWPKKNQTISPVNYMEVTYIKEDDMNWYNLVKVVVTTQRKGEKLIVNLICLKGWAAGDVVPPNCNSILSVRDEMSNISWNDNSPIIVTCYDGATASGLFVAMSFLIEKIKLEHSCDIVLAVRTVRQSRMQFVQHEEQFQFLLRVVLEYFKLFNTYSNFEK